VAGSKRTINGVIARALARARADAAPTRVWAVVDAARDPRIGATVREASTRGVCLYGDDVPIELACAAPWVVPMPPDSTFGALFASTGRGRAWGIVTRSDAPREAVAQHFTTLLRAQLPDGRVVLFRFYDPRVLRAYLPTCTPDELAQIFGPCAGFLLEQADGGQREYVLEQGALVVREPRWDLWID
jgi:hypothetical protein